VEWTAEDSSETLTLSSLQSEILCVEWDVQLHTYSLTVSLHLLLLWLVSLIIDCSVHPLPADQ